MVETYGRRDLGLNPLLDKMYTKYLDWQWLDNETFISFCRAERQSTNK
jgi:hypothetical protein